MGSRKGVHATIIVIHSNGYSQPGPESQLFGFFTEQPQVVRRGEINAY